MKTRLQTKGCSQSILILVCVGESVSVFDEPKQQSLSFRGTVEARFVYVFVLGILFTGVKDLLRSQVMSSAADSGRLKSRGLWEVYSGVVLLVALLFRAHNLPTLACCLLIQTVMAQFIWKKLHYDAAQTTIMHYWFGQAFFFFQVMRRGEDLEELLSLVEIIEVYFHP